MARAADFDLACELTKPSFTPAQRDAPALVALVVRGDEPAATKAATALGTLGAAGRAAIEVAPVPTDDVAARSRLVATLGLIARGGDARAHEAVIGFVVDAEVRVRRAAITALGKLGGDDARDALLARWDAGDLPADERRTLAEALGKVGGDAALERLRVLEPGEDAELARRRDRALLMADRDAKRGEDSEVRVDVAPPSPLAVRLHCKPGLAPLLVDELRAALIEGQADGDAAVELVLAAPWQTLYRSRLWATAGIRIPRGRSGVQGIVDALTAPATRALLAAWTRGPIRWRLQLAGKQRAVVWNVARDVTAGAPELVNDPTHTTWDVLIDDSAPDVIELRPRRVVDPRFAYRVAEVPAASHPSIAAALARLGEARDGDRVWDPFVGSALELIERARLGPAGSFAGTDLSELALVAARANLAAAGVTATVTCGDARAATGERDLDLVITNPPLGSRIQVDAAALLVEILPVIARRLAHGGRLVWITPAPKKTTQIAERLGLRRGHCYDVDLGGVRGRLERWDVKS